MSEELKAAQDEIVRLRAALKSIADTIEPFEGRGDYMAYVLLSSDLLTIANEALKVKP